jgi:hypothetical protein
MQCAPFLERPLIAESRGSQCSLIADDGKYKQIGGGLLCGASSRLPCRDHRVWLDERAIDLLAFHAKTRWSRTVLGMVSSPPVSRSGVVEITAR